MWFGRFGICCKILNGNPKIGDDCVTDTISIPAHFDGEQIRLDGPVKLELNARMVVTVLPDDDAECRDWFEQSARNLEEAYSDDEPEYPLDLIEKTNPDYEGR